MSRLLRNLGLATTPSLATQCPLCNQANNCAIEADKASTSCWCQQITIRPELIAAANKLGPNKVCICQSCAEKAHQLSREIE